MRPSFSLRSVLLLWMASRKSVVASSHFRGSAHKLEESPSDRRLDSHLTNSTANQAAIQSVLTDSIPATTFDLRNRLDDPLALNLTATVPLDCDTLQLQLDFEMLRGLTTVNLNYLSLQNGSEVVSGCILDQQQLWKGAVAVGLSFGSDLVAGQVGARVVGSCLGIVYNAPLTASATSSGTQLKGIANMEGTFGSVDTITKTNFLSRLDLTSTITSSVSLIPPALNAGLIQSQIEAAFRSQLVQVVEPHIRAKLERLIPGTLFGTVNALVGYLPQVLYGFAENLFGMVQGNGESEVALITTFDDDE
jgi:hypothetical protein